MAAPSDIQELVERFRRNIDHYHRTDYNETQVRREFIDPLFVALGWDVDNRRGVMPRYQEVIHEATVREHGAVRSPDYCFRVGPERKFFVEAKKPAVDIRYDIHPAFQLRRYAWTAKLPLSILTDFEEFSVYDCRFRPSAGDNAAKARTLYITYDEFVDRWDEIENVFGREAVWQGDFDRYAESTFRKRGTQEVDAAFLQAIEEWRKLLARNIALRNPNLSVRDLNYAVQQIIDRIIFLRICEDRDIEPYEQLKGVLQAGQAYQELVNIFQRADDRYNSGLFHFRRETGRAEDPDTLTPALKIDDKVLAQIINSLYYPESPYAFSVLGADTLGYVYEQFLGSVIRLTSAHRAEVEQKPEVRKAGGVYYTPRYIVDYIVEQTVGKLIEGKPPGQISHLRILDPACGSGSFLLGAYQRILDYHLNWYVEHPTKGGRSEIYEGAGGDWFLTTEEKKRILLGNIYGVDIDSQAVEVTKLSLLLKVLEDESQETIAGQMKIWQERVLPDLGSNIKCGNSLIGPDFYVGRQMGLGLLDDEQAYRINAFDWDAEFPEIMRAGGFDAVIGNPPYVRIQAMKEWAPVEVEFYKERYVSASKGNYDIYVVFVEKGLSLLNERGRLGFILPHKFFNAKYGEALRGLLAQGRHLGEVVHFGDQQVFANATTYTCLLFLDKGGNEGLRFVKAHDLGAWRQGEPQLDGMVSADNVTAGEWNFIVGKGAALFEKLSHIPVKLHHIADRMAQGIRTSANEVYVLDVISEDDGLIHAKSTQLDRVVMIERDLVSAFLQGREIKSYRILHSGKVVIIPYRMQGNQARLIPEPELKQQYPHTYAYLRENKQYLENRERGRMRGSNWYAYVYPKNIDVMATPKVLVPDIADNAAFAFDPSGVFAFTSGYGVTLLHPSDEAYLYLLGLLNSTVLDFYVKQISTTMRGGFFRYFTQYIEQLPIRTTDFDDPADVARHDHMVALAERMLDLHKQLADARTPTAKTMLQRQIDATDRQIDRLVYELYDLTDEEIAIVEEQS